MKHIDKGDEPSELIAWKAQASADWQPTWACIANPERAALREALLMEQGFICCYCQARITGNTDSHIEHFKPRSSFPAEELNYENLHVSCNNQRHCGKNKSNWYDSNFMISPLEPNCEDQFTYTSDGEVLATENASRQIAAETMIARLNLNFEGLIRRRREAIDGAIFGIETLSHEEIGKLIRGYSERNTAGQFGPFCRAIIEVLQKY